MAKVQVLGTGCSKCCYARSLRTCYQLCMARPALETIANHE